jgi:hypothetical protein
MNNERKETRIYLDSETYKYSFRDYIHNNYGAGLPIVFVDSAEEANTIIVSETSKDSASEYAEKFPDKLIYLVYMRDNLCIDLRRFIPGIALSKNQENPIVEQFEFGESPKRLDRGFGSPMGTSRYYRTRNCLITDGVKELAEALHIEWLIMAVGELIPSIIEKHNLMTQIWKLCVKNEKATLYCLGLPEPPDYDKDEVVFFKNFDGVRLEDGELLLKVGYNVPPIICLLIED